MPGAQSGRQQCLDVLRFAGRTELHYLVQDRRYLGSLSLDGEEAFPFRFRGLIEFGEHLAEFRFGLGIHGDLLLELVGLLAHGRGIFGQGNVARDQGLFIHRRAHGRQMNGFHIVDVGNGRQLPVDIRHFHERHHNDAGQQYKKKRKAKREPRGDFQICQVHFTPSKRSCQRPDRALTGLKQNNQDTRTNATCRPRDK